MQSFVTAIFAALTLFILNPFYCHSDVISKPIKGKPGQNVTKKTIRNFSYKLEMAGEECASGKDIIKLTNGIFVSKKHDCKVYLEKFLLKDLNGDGFEDAVIILVGNYGGSGSFYELTCLLGGEAIKQSNSITLGDRVVIKDIFIRDGKTSESAGNKLICIKMIAHKPTDPLCCPSKDETRCFSLKNETLEESEPTCE